MINIDKSEIAGWYPALRSMRNPLNSWNKSDTVYGVVDKVDGVVGFTDYDVPEIGDNDLRLMKSLCAGGTEHRKFLRMINVYLEIEAPLYFYKELDTYKVGTVSNSCSTMHTIHKRPIRISDFSADHLSYSSVDVLNTLIELMNIEREKFIETKDKRHWWQIIQLLPTSFNQRRTIMINYEVAMNMIKQRKNHKLDEWRMMVEYLEKLPYMKELIDG